MARDAECLKTLLFYNPYANAAADGLGPRSPQSPQCCRLTALCDSFLVSLNKRHRVAEGQLNLTDH